MGAEIEEAMSEPEHAAAVVVAHRAEARDGQVAVHQHAGNGLAGLERLVPAQNWLRRIRIARCAAERWHHTHLVEVRLELLERGFVEAGEAERRANRHQGGIRQGQTRRGGRQELAGHWDCVHGGGCGGRAGVGRTGTVDLVNLEHILDRRDAADGIGRKDAEPQSNGAHQLAADVDRAAAHAARDVRARRFAAQFGQDDVLLRSPSVFPQPDDLDGHGLWPCSLKHGPSRPGQAGANVGCVKNLNRPGLGRFERSFRGGRGHRDAAGKRGHQGHARQIHGVPVPYGGAAPYLPIICEMRCRRRVTGIWLQNPGSKPGKMFRAHLGVCEREADLGQRVERGDRIHGTHPLRGDMRQPQARQRFGG